MSRLLKDAIVFMHWTEDTYPSEENIAYFKENHGASPQKPCFLNCMPHALQNIVQWFFSRFSYVDSEKEVLANMLNTVA